MTTPRHRFEVISSAAPRTPDFRRGAAVVAVIVLCIALFMAIIQAATSKPVAANLEAAPQQSDTDSASVPFEYFPAQYVNQAKEVEEHIEAF